MALSARVGLSGEDNQKCPFYNARKGHESEQVRSGDPPTSSVVGWLDRNSAQYAWNSTTSPSGRPVGGFSWGFCLRNRVHRTRRGLKWLLGNKLSAA
jgi:hypothetical protein